MATQPYVPVDTPFSSGGLEIVKWTLANGDDGAPVRCRYRADRSIQVSGTFGAAGNVAIQGALDADTPVWAVLNDPHQVALNFTTAKIESVLEATYMLRPVVTVGDGTTALVVVLFMLGTRG